MDILVFGCNYFQILQILYDDCGVITNFALTREQFLLRYINVF